MDSTVIAATIAAGAAILAAIIAGLFASRKKKDQATQSAQAGNHGGHAIAARDGAVINIGSQNAPSPNKLLLIAHQLRDRTNESLIENQRILSPVIRNPELRYSIGRSMARLFEEQRDRAAFGEWQSFLESALARETNPQAKSGIQELLVCVRQLYRSFYSYSESIENRGEA